MFEPFAREHDRELGRLVEPIGLQRVAGQVLDGLAENDVVGVALVPHALPGKEIDDVVRGVVLEEIVDLVDERDGVGRVVVLVHGQHHVGGRHRGVVDPRAGVGKLHREVLLGQRGRDPGQAGIDVGAGGVVVGGGGERRYRAGEVRAIDRPAVLVDVRAQAGVAGHVRVGDAELALEIVVRRQDRGTGNSQRLADRDHRRPVVELVVRAVDLGGILGRVEIRDPLRRVDEQLLARRGIDRVRVGVGRKVVGQRVVLVQRVPDDRRAGKVARRRQDVDPLVEGVHDVVHQGRAGVVLDEDARCSSPGPRPRPWRRRTVPCLPRRRCTGSCPGRP